MDAVDSAYQVERIHVFTEPIDEVLIRRELLNSTWNLLNDPGLISRQKSFWDFVSFTIGKAEEKQLRSEW